MNKLMTIVAASSIAAFAGCRTIPTPETMSVTATAIGVAAGSIANQTALSERSREEIIETVNAVDKVVPEAGQKFSTAWMPIAQQKVAELLDSEVIDNGQAVLILEAFSLACDGIDYLFDVRFPEARKHEDLVSSAVHGFTYGFLLEFRRTGDGRTSFASGVRCGADYAGDREAYEYLLEKHANR